MTFRRVLCSSILLLFALTVAAGAESIAAFTDHVGAGSPTQMGIPAFTYNPQDWAGDEAYPGVAPESDAYVYHTKTYTYAASDFTGAPYVELSFNDLFDNGDVFFSAYSSAYNSSNRAANWLGDVGLQYDLIPSQANQFEVKLSELAACSAFSREFEERVIPQRLSSSWKA